LKRFIGCDPGKSGALVCISSDGVEIVPFDEIAYRDTLERWSKDECYAVLEAVSAMPGNGAVSMFSFGDTFGFVRGMLLAFRISYQTMRPQSWKKLYNLNLGKDKTKAEKKAASIAVCNSLFPNVSLKRTERCAKPDDNIADALLLAETARRIFSTN